MLIRIFYACSNPLFYGGEGGIRTLDTVLSRIIA